MVRRGMLGATANRLFCMPLQRPMCPSMYQILFRLVNVTVNLMFSTRNYPIVKHVGYMYLKGKFTIFTKLHGL